MLGAPSQWFACMTSQIVLGRSPFYGIRHGAAMALVATQARSGHNLWLLPHGFPAAVHPRDHERLVEDFFSTANSVAFNTQADDIVSKVFSGP